MIYDLTLGGAQALADIGSHRGLRHQGGDAHRLGLRGVGNGIDPGAVLVSSGPIGQQVAHRNKAQTRQGLHFGGADAGKAVQAGTAVHFIPSSRHLLSTVYTEKRASARKRPGGSTPPGLSSFNLPCQAAKRSGQSLHFPPIRAGLQAAVRLSARPHSSPVSLLARFSTLLYAAGSMRARDLWAMGFHSTFWNRAHTVIGM